MPPEVPAPDGRSSADAAREGDSPAPAWRQYAQALGPGLVTGASDDDPSAIATYASASSKVGLSMLWTGLLAFPLILAVQISADRTALATGKSIGELARDRFGRRGRRAVLVMIVCHAIGNVLVIAADLVAIGAGLNLLLGGPASLWGLAAGVAITALVLKGSFESIAAVLKLLCLALLGYVGVLFVVNVDWPNVLRHTLVPEVHANAEYLRLLLAVLGATLPPYVFFWQNAHRIEELREEPLGGDQPATLRTRSRADRVRKRRTSTLDVACGMVFAIVVMLAVMIATAAATSGGGRPIETAADAAKALEPVAGGAAQALFGIGFIAAGALAIPVLAGAGSVALSGFLRHDWGFSRSIGEAPLFYGLVAVGTVTGALLSLAGIPAIRLLVTAATVNGVTSAPLMAVVMIIASDRRRMGAERPGRIVRGLGWAAVAMMTLATLGLLLTAA